MDMSILQAVVLGLVEGLTEFLPVSSTGHLILAQRAMGIEQGAAADAYAIVIQAGAMLAVLGLYARLWRRMGSGLLGRDAGGRRLLAHVVLAMLPAVVVGLLALDFVQESLFGLWPIVAAWFVGGCAILTVGWYRRHTHRPIGLGIFDLTWRRALAIGLIQCIALWPGTSRSLVTIVGGVLAGLGLEAAVVFSFLLGAATLAAGTLYEATASGGAMLHSYGPPSLLAGLAAAALSAFCAVKWMVSYLQRHGLALFGYYRVALALVVAGLLLSGHMASRY
jgi:undecaprenyl-diphosphatase